MDYVDDYLFDGDFILLGEDGTVVTEKGKPVLQQIHGKSWVNNHAHVITADNQIDFHFLYYLLMDTDVRAIVTGAVQPKISQANLKTVMVSVPDLQTQRKIAAVLSALDDKIENNRRICKTLEEMAQAIFKSWFVDFEPWGGVMPEGWRRGTLSDVGEIVGGATPSKSRSDYYTENGIAWITPKDLSVQKTKFVSRGEVDISEAGFKNASVKMMPRGSVLFSSRAPIGYVAIAQNQVCTNQGFKSVVPKSDVGTAFIYEFLSINVPLVEERASGSTFKEISLVGMRDIPLCVPALDATRRYERLVEPLFRQQEVLESEVHRLVGMRDALLPKLMSGEIDVDKVVV